MARRRSEHILGWAVVAGVLQQALVQVVVQWRSEAPYSMHDNFISDLGNSACGPLWLPPYAYVCSPWWWLMDLSLLVYALAWLAAGRLFPGPEGVSVRRALTLTGAFALLIAIPENLITTLHFTGVFAYCGLAVFSAAVAARRWQDSGHRSWARWSWLVALLSVVLYVPAGLSGSTGDLVLGWALGAWQRVALLPAACWVVSVGVAAGLRRLPRPAVLGGRQPRADPASVRSVQTRS